MARPDPDKARGYLAAAIALHEQHMNGTAPTTGPKGEKSQADVMHLMQQAHKALTGEDAPGTGAGTHGM